MARERTPRFLEFPIPLDRGGFNYNPNIDTVPSWAMVDSSKNINLQKGGRSPRGGTSHVTGVSMASRTMGLKHFKSPSSVDFKVRATADGKIYRNDADTISTGWQANMKVRFEVMNKYLLACNGYNIPKYWDGVAASMSNITTPHVDWTGVNYPSKFIIHGRGVSRRMFALGCLSTPYSLYYSDNDNPLVFSGTPIDIDTSDDVGLRDFVVYGDRLIVGGKDKFYLLNDEDASTANWGYQEAQWNGGTVRDMLIKTPTDIIAMADTGEVYSVLAAQKYGDYEYASLSNPTSVALNENPHISDWIQENIDLTKLDNFHSCVDRKNRCVYLFMTPIGYITNKVALVYFYERPPAEAWMIHNNYSYDSGYDASCSASIETSTGNYEVWTGDYDGLLWKLQQTNLNDNGNPYYHGFTSPYINCGLDIDKVFKEGVIVTQPEGSYYLKVNTHVDLTLLPQKQISLDGGGSLLDSFVLDVDSVGGANLSVGEWNIGSVGMRVKCELFNSSINEDFFLSRMIIRFKPLGVLPK